MLAESLRMLLGQKKKNLSQKNLREKKVKNLRIRKKEGRVRQVKNLVGQKVKLVAKDGIQKNVRS